MDFRDTALIVGIIVVVQVPLALLANRSKLLMARAHKRFRRDGAAPPREVVDAAHVQLRRIQILTIAVWVCWIFALLKCLMQINDFNIGFMVAVVVGVVGGVTAVLSLESAKRSRTWYRQLQYGTFQH